MGAATLRPLALVVTALYFSTCSSAAIVLDPRCNGQYEWFPDGSRKPGNPRRDWSIFSRDTGFQAGPCLGTPGIGVTQTWAKTVVIIDRTEGASSVYLPRSRVKAHAVELDLSSNKRKQRSLDIITNTFCSSGQHGPDGTFYSIAGDWTSGGHYSEGEFSIRGFSPCNDGKCDFELVDSMVQSRWYPTTVLLGDGRMMFVGGSHRGTDVNYAEIATNNIEYFPRAKGERDYKLQFLERTMPFNLYPFVHVLPSGKAFIFAGKSYTLYDTSKNVEVSGVRPDLNTFARNRQIIYRNYPLSGTSALFPIRPNTTAEVMICGGNNRKAKWGHNITGDAYMQADNHCWRIQPEARKPTWIMETMKYARVMPIAVLLPTGGLFITGGSQTGFSGFGNSAHNASLTPEIYDTSTYSWYPGPLATSKIPRVYHASSLILHDGSVLISGSNPNLDLVQGGQDFPTDFRTEFFYPPYMKGGLVNQVKVLQRPANVSIGMPFSMTFSVPWSFRTYSVKVVLVQPGFSTHGANHGMRNVELSVISVQGVTSANGTYTVTAAGPPTVNHCPPTWYWLFVVVGGVPNNDGFHVFVKP